MNHGDIISAKEGKQILSDNVSVLRKNILRILHSKRISKTELGSRIDKDKFYINYIINDVAPNPTLDGMGKIAFALDVHIYELLKP